MNRDRRMDVSSLTTGIILIGMGLLFLLDRMDVADFGDAIHDYWPCILILIGITQLFRREKVWSGLWLIAVGCWMQISHLRLFGLTWSSSWPLLLIAGGAGLILRALVDGLTGVRANEKR